MKSLAKLNGEVLGPEERVRRKQSVSHGHFFKSRQLNSLWEDAGRQCENSPNEHSLKNIPPWLTAKLIDMWLKIHLYWGWAYKWLSNGTLLRKKTIKLEISGVNWDCHRQISHMVTQKYVKDYLKESSKAQSGLWLHCCCCFGLGSPHLCVTSVFKLTSLMVGRWLLTCTSWFSLHRQEKRKCASYSQPI